MGILCSFAITSQGTGEHDGPDREIARRTQRACFACFGIGTRRLPSLACSSALVQQFVRRYIWCGWYFELGWALCSWVWQFGITLFSHLFNCARALPTFGQRVLIRFCLTVHWTSDWPSMLLRFKQHRMVKKKTSEHQMEMQKGTC